MKKTCSVLDSANTLGCNSGHGHQELTAAEVSVYTVRTGRLRIGQAGGRDCQLTPTHQGVFSIRASSGSVRGIQEAWEGCKTAWQSNRATVAAAKNRRDFHLIGQFGCSIPYTSIYPSLDTRSSRGTGSWTRDQKRSSCLCSTHSCLDPALHQRRRSLP